MMNEPLVPYAAVILKLLRGVLYYDDKEWNTLLSYQQAVKQHFTSIGLMLHVDEADGYAYLTQPDAEDRDDEPLDDAAPVALPRLVRRVSLGYEATLLCVVLREELLKFEAHEPDLERLVLSKAQLQDALQIFYPEPTDMTRLLGRIERVIGSVVRAGFLRPLNRDDNNEWYEVKRILKAKLSADRLVEIRDQLRRYADTRSRV
jgi:Domain of unknown function (DUF4194)